MGGSPLSGKHVLVVEDEGLVAMLIEDVIAGVGATLVAICADVAKALSVIGEAGTQIDVALLDLNLGGEKSFPVAEALAERGVPFAFSTGYQPGAMPEEWADVPSLQKPFMEKDLLATLEQAISQGAPAARSAS